MPGKRNPQRRPKQQRKKQQQQQKPAPAPYKVRVRRAMKKPRSKFGSLETVAAIQALPGDYAAFRIPSASPERTAVLKFVDERPFSVTASSANFAIVTRSPTRSLWLSKTNPATLAAASYVKRTYVSANKYTIPNNAGESLAIAPLLQLDSSSATPFNHTFTSPELLPNYPLAVDHNNGVWFYFPAGGMFFQFVIETDVTLSGGPHTFGFEVVQNFSTSNIKTFTVQGGTQGTMLAATVTSSPERHGFIRPILLTTEGTTTGDGKIVSISAGITTNGSLTAPTAANTGGLAYTPTMYFEPPPDTAAIGTSTAPFSDSRVTALSVLFMNDTQELHKEGRVNALRVPCKSQTQNVFSTLMPANFSSWFELAYDKDKFGGHLAKGLYMFTRPDELSLPFRDWTNSATPAGSVIRLDAFDFIDVIRFTDRNNLADTNLTAVLSYHVEWINCTVLWPSLTQRLPYEAWRQSIATLGETRNYSENPIHIRDLLARIGRGLRWAAPIVAPYAKQAGFALARAALL